MKLFLAFTGVKESGKTTSFRFLKEANPEIVEVTLANHLKDVCSKVFGIPRENFDDQRFKEKELETLVYLNPENITALIKAFEYEPNFDVHVRPHIGIVLETPRRVAQYIGTEVLRALNPDIHCEYATKKLPESGTFVVTDMRFQNEFDFFKTRHSKTFFPLHISNYAAESRVGPNAHASEKEVLTVARQCERIDNNNSLDALKSEILKKYSEILNRGEQI